MIHSHVKLETIICLLVFRGNDTRIVYQNVQPLKTEIDENGILDTIYIFIPLLVHDYFNGVGAGDFRSTKTVIARIHL